MCKVILPGMAERGEGSCDLALSVFALKCQSECHAVKAALCDLGDPDWGDP